MKTGQGHWQDERRERGWKISFFRFVLSLEQTRWKWSVLEVWKREKSEGNDPKRKKVAFWSRERKGKERKGKERKGIEREGKELKGIERN